MLGELINTFRNYITSRNIFLKIVITSLFRYKTPIDKYFYKTKRSI